MRYILYIDSGQEQYSYWRGVFIISSVNIHEYHYWPNQIKSNQIKSNQIKCRSGVGYVAISYLMLRL